MQRRPMTYRKERRDAPVGFFQAEACGLRWLAEAEPAGGTRVVRVHEVGEQFIDVEQVRAVAPTRQAADAFGKSLAVLHTAGAAAFGTPPEGWHGPSWIGRQPQANEPEPTWGRFYAEQRVRPFVHAAERAGHLGTRAADQLDDLCDRISGGEFDDDRAPARLHGDLWSGNVVHAPDGVCLIDPAAHGGHGMTDLAMLMLFGLPGLDRVLDSYAEAAALPTGWRDLVGLHQLHPLAVHAVTHGRSYGEELVAVARRYR
ncbi:MAG: fructosamine kinase family protein [Intrasporangium sp.]|uniref:fructosamine kinase family protein n=1 Tax=Intrasporangium sp. TaxID=1925024 RepID=UPI0026497F49|nr:fructosamine kinase family protein [Intrasporangium sp.]MDN5794738.1 fructosamine kinase family protein [Intrasporangium sp.]